MQKTVWGVLSTAKIGVNKVIPALMQSDLIRVKGLASRNFDAAKSAVETLGLEAAYGSYEDLLANAYDEALFDFYATAQLTLIHVHEGKLGPVKASVLEALLFPESTRVPRRPCAHGLRA